jgi:hypothetical protein
VFLYFALTYLTAKALLGSCAIADRHVIKGLAIAYCILVIIGLLQSVTGTPIGLFATYFGADSAEGAYHQQVFRVSGTMTSPNVFANCLVLLMPAGLFATYSMLARSQAMLPLAILLAITFFLVVESGSRAGLVYFTVSLSGIYFFWLRSCSSIRNKWITFFAILPVVVAVILSVFGSLSYAPSIVARFFVSGDSGRFSQYSAALSLLQDPKVILTGVGAGQFFDSIFHESIPIQYKPWMDLRDIPSTVHNWMLQILSELGVFVFGAWVYFIVSIFRRSVYVFKRCNDIFILFFGFNFLALFVFPLQFDTSIGNPSIVSLVALSGSLVAHKAGKNSTQRNLY